jgi:hypothetical protein
MLEKSIGRNKGSFKRASRFSDRMEENICHWKAK